MPRRARCSSSSLFVVVVVVLLVTLVDGGGPDPSSVALRTHRSFYAGSPPHETSLYDRLGVRPNATSAEIADAYEQRRRDHDHDDDDEASETLREAYEVLKNDSARLSYHRFGVLGDDDDEVVALLTGGRSAVTTNDPRRRLLLRWMGFSPHVRTHEQRVELLAAHLAETVRPVVENALSRSELARELVATCERLTSLPLGSRVLRCVGRACRRAGSSFRFRRGFATGALDGARSGLRRAANAMDAAVAAGRFRFATRGVARDDADLANARSAVARSLRTETLWRTSKIGLDRAVQEACRRTLSGTYFVNHDRRRRRDGRHDPDALDGWVGSSGEAIDADVGRARAAATLVLVGETLVRCSKEGTSWVD